MLPRAPVWILQKLMFVFDTNLGIFTESDSSLRLHSHSAAAARSGWQQRSVEYYENPSERAVLRTRTAASHTHKLKGRDHQVSPDQQGRDTQHFKHTDQTKKNGSDWKESLTHSHGRHRWHDQQQSRCFDWRREHARLPNTRGAAQTWSWPAQTDRNK